MYLPSHLLGCSTLGWGCSGWGLWTRLLPSPECSTWCCSGLESYDSGLSLRNCIVPQPSRPVLSPAGDFNESVFSSLLYFVFEIANVSPVILLPHPPTPLSFLFWVDFFMTLTLYCLSIRSVFTDPRQLWESASGSNLCSSEVWQRPYLKKQKKNLIKKEDSSVLEKEPSHSHLCISSFVAFRIHGRQEVDSGLSHQPNHTLVALLVFFAQVLHEVEDELSAEDLVAVHPRHVAKLWLSCQRERLDSVWVSVNMKTQAHLDRLSILPVKLLKPASCVGQTRELATLSRWSGLSHRFLKVTQFQNLHSMRQQFRN